MELTGTTWLIVLTVGVVLLGAVIGLSMTRYRAWQNRRRRSRPTD